MLRASSCAVSMSTALCCSTWNEPIGTCRALHDLPKNALRYLTAIEDMVGCKAWFVSVGPDRAETIVVNNPWPAR